MKDMGGFNKTNITKGIHLYYIPTDKFKTFTVSIYIHQPLNKENATKNALLPQVLKRGSIDFPTSQDIARYLEELYGAVFDCGIVKKGENQIIRFNFETIEDTYVDQGEGLLQKTMKLAKQIVFEPLIENERFKKEYVEQEKQNLKNQIEGLINNKMSYAVERCYQEMCSNENFGIYELGSVEDLNTIDEKILYEHYLTVIHNSPIDIFVTGSISEDKVKQMVQNLFHITMDSNPVYPTTEIVSQVGEVKKVYEPMKVAQGKLSLGFRTKIAPTDKEYYPLVIFNGLFGGGPHSKLFNNVREKLSLAYYVFSRLEKFKGLMVVSSGIEPENYQKAFDEIMFQFEEIKKGNITDAEFDATINSAVNSIRSLADTAFYMEDYYLSQLVGGTNDDFEDLISKLSSVTKEDVVAVAQNIQLDTVYFLSNKEA